MSRPRIKNPKDFGRVAVLMGGWSAERQVSLWSGQAVFEALKRKGVDAAAIDANRANIQTLKQQGYDRVFIVLHGPGGEDGIAQAVLELQGLPYTGSGVLASALKMDKVAAKRVWKAEDLRTPDFRVLNSEDDAKAAAQKLGLPMVIKPVTEGSSVGITIVKREDQLAEAYRTAKGPGRSVMAEQFIKGGEYTVAILDGEALPSIRIVPEGEFYDYHAKYISDNTRYHCPSGLDAKQERRLGEIAVQAFELIGACGWGRVDFIVDAKGEPWLLEINTVPGMTSHSLVPMAAKAAGVGFDELCWAILETTLAEAGHEH